MPCTYASMHFSRQHVTQHMLRKLRVSNSCQLLGLSLKAEPLASVKSCEAAIANVAAVCPQAVVGVSYCLLIKKRKMLPQGPRQSGILEGKSTY